MPDLTVVGSLNMDLIIRTPHLPAAGETVIGGEFITAPGGKGANQAVAAAKLGAAVAMVGRAGADDFGRRLRAGLEAVGVDTRHLLSDERAATGVALIAVETGGENTIIVAPGANAALSRADVDAARETIAASRVLVAQLEVPLDTVTYAFEIARSAGVTTLLNPAPARPLAPDLLSRVDMLVPNESEARALTGIAVADWESAGAAALDLHRRGVPLVVITLGARGALACDRGAIHRVPAFPVNAVDATAAGDAFVAALAVAHARGSDLLTALRDASAAGALTATRLGAQPALPTRAEVDEFVRLSASI